MILRSESTLYLKVREDLRWKKRGDEGTQTLTPAQERRQAPGQRVEPHQADVDASAPPGGPLDGPQRFGDDDVAVDRDGEQVDHGGDSKQGPAEGVHLTAWQTRGEEENPRMISPLFTACH